MKSGFLIKAASHFRQIKNSEAVLASNAIKVAIKEASEQDGPLFNNALENIAAFATILDFDGHVKAASLLDIVIKNAQELWPSANDRDERYDAKANNAKTLFRALENQKTEDVEPILSTMKGTALSLLTRYSPDYPGVPLLRVSDGVYQDVVSRKVYDFNRGWVSESGEKHPGGSIAHQTPTSSDYLGYNQIFDSSRLRTRPR
jgi:hypothetical protein